MIYLYMIFNIKNIKNNVVHFFIKSYILVVVFIDRNNTILNINYCFNNEISKIFWKFYIFHNKSNESHDDVHNSFDYYILIWYVKIKKLSLKINLFKSFFKCINLKFILNTNNFNFFIILSFDLNFKCNDDVVNFKFIFTKINLYHVSYIVFY